MKSITIFLIALSIFSCGGSPTSKELLLDKKWYYTSDSIAGYIVFKENGSFELNFNNGPIGLQGRYEIISDNELKFIHGDLSGDQFSNFQIKDSVLLLTIKYPNRIDSTFYHLNPKYKSWQSKQIFIYGKVMTEQEPLPYIKFEF